MGGTWLSAVRLPQIRGSIPLLVGLGVDELSVTPGSITTVRAVLASLDPATCRESASRALSATTLADVEALTG